MWGQWRFCPKTQQALQNSQKTKQTLPEVCSPLSDLRLTNCCAIFLLSQCLFVLINIPLNFIKWIWLWYNQLFVQTIRFSMVLDSWQIIIYLYKGTRDVLVIVEFIHLGNYNQG